MIKLIFLLIATKKETILVKYFNGVINAQWELIKPYFPVKKNSTGRPYADFRCVINSILFALSEGGRWASIPQGEQWAARSTAHNWLEKMKKNGTWRKIQVEIIKKADLEGKIGWKNISVDGSFAPGKGGGEKIEYGYKGKGSTINLTVDENGMPLVATVTPASGNEKKEVFKMLDSPIIPKDGRVKNLHADKGYDANSLREELKAIGINPVIPYRNYKNQAKKK